MCVFFLIFDGDHRQKTLLGVAFKLRNLTYDVVTVCIKLFKSGVSGSHSPGTPKKINIY